MEPVERERPGIWTDKTSKFYILVFTAEQMQTAGAETSPGFLFNIININ